MPFELILKTIFYFILLIAMMYGILYLVKRFAFSYNAKGKSSMQMDVIATKMIMPKKYISVIQVHKKVFLIGVSDNSVNLISELDEIPPIEDLEQEAGDKKSFFDYMKQNMGKR